MPYTMWRILTIAIYGYRFAFLPLLIKLTGYAKYVDWVKPKLGTAQPKLDSWESVVYEDIPLTKKGRLATVNFGDSKFETMLFELYKKTTHLSPHTQSPGHPLVQGFPGNFMNHLTGVYKILTGELLSKMNVSFLHNACVLHTAWRQPQYVCRAGLFHSVYGTYDYRAGVYDLRKGREELRTLIGPGAEELAFAICTSDRLGLLSDLCDAMYGPGSISRFGAIAEGIELNKADGNPLPPLIGRLTEEGFPLRNHITQVSHVIPADCFAQFVVVFAADFMDQGALPFASADMDICLFQFMRFRFFNDVLRFVSPFLRVVPPVFQKYMWDKPFLEPSRSEVLELKRLWKQYFSTTKDALALTSSVNSDILEKDKQTLLRMAEGYPFLPEPKVLLAGVVRPGEVFQGYTCQRLAVAARQVVEEWGMMSFKKTSVGEVLDRLDRVAAL